MDKIWLKNYPHDVPAEINPDRYQSITEIFEQSCHQYADQPAFYNLGTTLTYKQLDSASRAFAAYLQQILYLKKGDRIALMMPNILQYPVALFGAFYAGLTVVNVNPLYTVPELSYQLKNSGAKVIIVLDHFANTVEKAMQETALQHVIVTEIGDLLPSLKAWLIRFVLKYIRKKIPNWKIPHAIKFKNILSAGKKLSLQPVTLTHQDIAFLQYTGGTTGISKGAILSHRNIVANILQAEAWFKSLIHSGCEIMITPLPLYHIFSLLGNCLYITRMGGLNVLITNPRDVPNMIKTMSKFKFTGITGVNTLFNALLKNPKFSKLDFSQLKLGLGGGMALQHAVAEKWYAVTGKVLLEAYGLTEASPCVAINPPDLKNYNGAVGLPVSSTNVCILDESTNEVAIGQSGELAVKGPQVMSGYWNNASETQKVFTKEGWLLTGDIASMDEQGYIHLLERKKDMILVSGFNVYPNEVEDAIAMIPGVLESAVIGIPDEHSGEVVKAFIVKSDNNLSIEDIQHFLHEKLTAYKIPKFIEFRNELPKSNVGKILRRALR